MSGLFIVLEGVEGAGKSTQARLLSQWMDAQEITHTLAREPGGTPVGEAIRRVVLDKGDLTMPPETELFLIPGRAYSAVVLTGRLPRFHSTCYVPPRADLDGVLNRIPPRMTGSGISTALTARIPGTASGTISPPVMRTVSVINSLWTVS